MKAQMRKINAHFVVASRTALGAERFQATLRQAPLLTPFPQQKTRTTEHEYIIRIETKTMKQEEQEYL